MFETFKKRTSRRNEQDPGKAIKKSLKRSFGSRETGKTPEIFLLEAEVSLTDDIKRAPVKAI